MYVENTYALTLIFAAFFFFFWLHYAACRIVGPPPGIELVPPTVEVQSPNPWTTRELPFAAFLIIRIS